MAKVIDFTKAKEVVRPTGLAGIYYMDIEIDGITRTIELTGDELFRTTCPACGCKVSLEFGDFINIMYSGDLYGTVVLCTECSAKRNKEE